MAITLIAGLAAAGSAWAAAGFALSLGAAFGAFAIGAGLSLVSRALMPKPDLGAQMGGQSVMTREAASSRKIVYGRARIGGNVVYLESTGSDNKYLYLVMAVAGHEIDAYEEVWFNDKKVWDGGVYQSGWATAGNSSTSPYVDIQFYKGDQTAADSGLVAASNKWTTDHKLLDTAYMVIRLTHDVDQFAQGLPNISTLIRGKKVLNPDGGAVAWSQNPALCIYDYLRDTKYGLGEEVANILTASVNTAKAVCDESVPISGGNQPRYTIDGVVNSANSIKSNIELMIGSMAGRLVYSGGKFEVHAGEYVAPAYTVDESQIIGEITVQTKQSRRNAYNGVKGVFLSEEDNYILADYPAQISSSFALQDGDPIYLDMALPFTTNNIRAQRLAKLALFRSRQQEAITIPCNLSALRFKIGDNINVTNTRLGYNQKIFEVVGYSMDFRSDGQILVNVDAIETAASIWAWQASDQEVFLGAGEVALYTGTVATPPATVAVSGDTFIASDGTTSSFFNVTWPTSVDAFVDRYVVEWAVTEAAGSLVVGKSYEILTKGNTAWTGIGASSNTNGVIFIATGVGAGTGIAVRSDNYSSQETRLSPFIITNVESLKVYYVKVKAINELGVSSVYKAAQQTAAIDTTPPSVPTNPLAKGEYRQITVSWTPPTQTDLLGVEVFRSPTGLVNSFFYVGSGDTSFIDTDLDTPREYFYRIRSYDRTFNKSAYAAIVSATSKNVNITAPDNPDVIIYDGESGLPPSVTSGRTTLDTNTSTFYLKQDYKEHVEMRLTYPLGALTSGSISGQANAINAVMAEFKFQVFYAPISSPSNFTQFGESSNKDVRSFRRTTTSNLSGSYYIKTTDLGGGNFKAELQKRAEVNALFPALGGRDLGAVDDNYNLTKRIIQYDFPAGEYVFKIVVVAVNGSHSPYPSTGSPSIALKRKVDPIGFQQVKKTGYSVAFEPFYQPITVFRDEESNEIVRLSEGADTLELSAINSSGVPVQAFVGGGASSTTAWGARIQFDDDLDTYVNGGIGQYQIGIDKSGTHLSLGTAPSGGGYPRGLNPSLSELRISSGRTDIKGSLYLNGVAVGTGSGSIANVIAGTNLNGGGTSGAVTLNLDSTISGEHTFSSNLIISGNLTVNGTTTTVDTDNLNVKDKNITLNYSTGDSSSTANGAGITIQDAVDASNNATILWNTTGDKFDFSHKVNAPSIQLGADAQPTLSGDGNTLRIQTTGGYFDIGANNSGFAHLSTDRTNFYFNKRITVDTGEVTSYNENLTLMRVGSTTARLRITDGSTISDQPLSVIGNIAVTGTVDGVDIAARNGVLTTTTNTANSANTTANAALPKSGGTMTGTLTMGSNAISSTGTIASGAITATSVISGNNSTAGLLRSHYSDGSYMTLEGYGLVMNRGASYIRPSSDGDKSLYIGGVDASLDWLGIYFRSTNGLYLAGSQFIDGSRNLTNIGTINSGAITSSGTVTAPIINYTSSLQYNGTPLLDNNRNLTNIVTISSGNITSSGTVTADDLALETDGASSELKFMSGGQFRSSLSYNNSSGLMILDNKYSVVDIHTGASGTSSIRARFNSSGLTVTGTISSGAITSSGSISARNDYVIATQGNAQLVLLDNTTPALNLRIGVDTAIGANGGASIQVTQSGVSNDRDLKLNPYGGKVGVGVSNTNNLTSTFTVNGTISSGAINVTSGGLSIGGTTVIDASRNLTSIADISSVSNVASKNLVAGLANGTFSSTKTIGALHIANGVGSSDAARQSGITFQGGSATQAQAGIYVTNDNSSGTHMAFATTNSYSTGPQFGLTISNVGVVNIPRNALQFGGNTAIDANRNLTVGTISSGNVSVGGSAYTTNADLNLLGDGLAIKNDKNGSNNNWSYIQNTSGGSQANLLFTTGAGSALTLNHDRTATFQGAIASGAINVTSGGLSIGGTTVIDNGRNITAGVIRGHALSAANARISTSMEFPVGHYSSADTVFEIDPTWTQAQLAYYFGVATSSINWSLDATAPDGYAIRLTGGVSVGGAYGSGFPYIPVGTDDIFYMECWIKNVGTNQTHYMGSNEYNQNFGNLGGNPGSYGYWVMLNTNVQQSSWTKVSGYITGFGNSIGQFESGAKYWTPMALFNYGAGQGTRACDISGWKIVKVNHCGNRTFEGNITASGDGFFNGTKLEGDSKEIIRFNDSWLRLNPANEFTSGIYCGTSILRTDGHLQVGSSGSKFSVNGANGNVTVAGTISSGAITSSDKVQADYIKVISSIPSETSANTGYLDFASGSTRIVSKGANGSTMGGFAILQQASDSSPASTSFSINASGNSTFTGTINSGAITTPSIQLGADTNPTLTGDSTYLKIQTVNGHVNIGAGNGTYLHITTDRGQFYFNKRLVVNEGIVQSYDQNLNLNRAGSTTARLRITAGKTISDQKLEVGGDTVTTRLLVGDGTDGVFYSDTAGRTAFNSGDFYIQTGVTNYYNYATNQYHGNTSGDNHFFRSNPLTGTNWSITAAGVISAASYNIGNSPTITASRGIPNKLTFATGIARSAHNVGHLEGSYNNIAANSDKSNPIYTIGSSYNPSVSALVNMYGIGYSHTNASFISLSGASGWGMYVAADGDARVYLGGSNGAISATGNIVAYASDSRLKTNIKPIENALEKLSKIRGVEYDWVDNITSEYDFHPSCMHETGVIAQEIQEVIPDAVCEAPMNGNYTAKCGTDHQFLTVQKDKIVPLLIEAVKEQQTEIDKLKSLVRQLLEK